MRARKLSQLSFTVEPSKQSVQITIYTRKKAGGGPCAPQRFQAVAQSLAAGPQATGLGDKKAQPKASHESPLRQEYSCRRITVPRDHMDGCIREVMK